MQGCVFLYGLFWLGILRGGAEGDLRRQKDKNMAMSVQGKNLPAASVEPWRPSNPWHSRSVVRSL